MVASTPVPRANPPRHRRLDAIEPELHALLEAVVGGSVGQARLGGGRLHQERHRVVALAGAALGLRQRQVVAERLDAAPRAPGGAAQFEHLGDADRPGV